MRERKETDRLPRTVADADAGIIREMLRHEDELTNQRTTWLMTIQGLLFAAMAFAWGNSPSFLYLLCAVGIAVSWSAGHALMAAERAKANLYEWWETRGGEGYDGPPVVGWRSKQESWKRWLRPWQVLPTIFVVAWLGIAVIVILQRR
jgi:hypothetical protein